MKRIVPCALILFFSLSASFPVLAYQESQPYYDFGVFAYEDGDLKGAEENFLKALASSPDNPAYHHYLGKTYLKMARYKDARIPLEKAWRLDPERSGLKYDMALLSYKTGNYAQGARLFSETAQEDSANIIAHYYAGVCLYKQKQYGRALDYFQAAAAGSPTIRANGYYYAGICHMRIGDTEKAVERLEYVRDHAESASLRKYAVMWLDAIDRREKALKPYQVHLKVGCQYDDNVRLEPLDEDIYPDEGDFAAVGYFSGKYDFLDKERWVLGAGYSHYQKWYDDLPGYDLVGSIFRFYGKYRLRPFTFGVTYLPSYYWVDSDSFLMTHQIRPEVSWKVCPDLLARLSYSYQRNNYFQNNDRDGHTNEVSLAAYYSLGEKRGYLFGGMDFEVKTAAHPDQRYEQYKLRLGMSLEIPWDFTLGLTGRFYEQNYEQEDSFYEIKREDAKYYGGVSLSHRFFHDWLDIIAEFNYTKNDSNINDYQYERKVTTLSLKAEF